MADIIIGMLALFVAGYCAGRAHVCFMLWQGKRP